MSAVISRGAYMFLRHPPAEWTLLRLLGPWPWYVASGAGVGLVLLFLLDVPFRPRRHRGPVEGPRHSMHRRAA